MKTYNLALIGASGLVGTTILTILETSEFPIGELRLFGSHRSAGKVVMFRNKPYQIELLSIENLSKYTLDIALMSAGGSVSKIFAPILLKQGVRIIDNSSTWRMKPSVPLIVPEVNGEDIGDAMLIANPNCSTIQSVLPLKVLDDVYGIKRVVYTTYQAVSGSGIQGISDLEHQSKKHYPHYIHANVIPHIDSFTQDGDTLEELKMIHETRKILKKPDLRVSATAVRVPIVNTHAVSINVELENPFEISDVFSHLEAFPGIVLYDNISENIYPIAEIADGKDGVYVGRVRRDSSVEHGLNLWCVSDNIRKGAALNTVQIAQYLIDDKEEEK